VSFWKWTKYILHTRSSEKISLCWIWSASGTRGYLVTPCLRSTSRCGKRGSLATLAQRPSTWERLTGYHPASCALAQRKGWAFAEEWSIASCINRKNY
jgi:hypothetical protein